MKSAILNKGECYYTYLGKVFNAIDNVQLKYNWLITDCVCYPDDDELDQLFSQNYVWISGDSLTKIINKNDLQFVWGVFSGFCEEISLNDVLKYNLPFANDNDGFWMDEVKIQHPLADIEIVSFDSSHTIFISKDDKLVEQFRRYFPLSDDLSEQNKKDNFDISHIQELLLKELNKRCIDVNEQTLYKKYLIWNTLYSKRDKIIKDEDILNYISKILD